MRNADNDIACFIKRMVRVWDSDRQRISEDRHRLMKRYTVSFQIRFRFVRVPFKPHDGKYSRMGEPT